MAPETPELAPAADTWPAWAKRTLWRHRRKLLVMAVAALLARFCGELAEPVATLCRALVAVADVMGG